MMRAVTLLAAYVLDRIIGDPRWLPHPVVGMGKCITWMEKGIRRWVPLSTPSAARMAGCLFPMILVGGVYGITELLLFAAERVSPYLALGLEILLIATTIATKGLADAARGIYEALAFRRLDQARKQLSMIVGRDTEQLDESEVVRGTVETVAENIVDAVTAPLFYAAVGGAPLALAYRAVNTLDSMVGYKDERYRDLGWASARFDDLANWLPARLTILPMLAVFFLISGPSAVRRAWHTYRRDARRHPSPNSGIPEALMAGGLGIRLGGTNWYRGVPSHRAQMGEPVMPRRPEHIQAAIRVLFGTTWVYTGMLVLVSLLSDWVA
ncbi:cobalamin biosynthesis protein CobD [Marinithermofilum abyssi]|uniref:Cobalamin biosynthesis protein CobD n=1 Tax=Marinithermofilum abyssi TaxID=1571185 RepID=A0A8J2YD78_9BACL|nr:adenosylcobinamide-phosphate synthase CbiB [Marinithermofilum abyssi]GGE07690.1 cobalamin biosynthesis protein CobD [Marinithermofilum abyssi]